MDEKTKKSVKSAKKHIGDNTTQRYLPFSEVRDNLMVMKDGSSRMVLKVNALNFNLKSEEEQDSIIYAYQRFLNSLNFPIQIIVRSLKVDIDGYINKLKNLAVKQSNPLLQEQTYRYIDFLVNLVDMAQIMKKDFYIVVPYDSDENRSVQDPGVFGIFRSFWASITQEETIFSIREKKRKVDNLKKGNHERLNQIKTSLENIGLKATEVKKDDLIKFLINYYNPKISSETKIKEDIDNFNFS
ncbi:MAG: TraC family protein [Candidatus Gracilibacteria bacterium]|nr:TraC family protein [Candidatus Gracilibacteria bacterium]